MASETIISTTGDRPHPPGEAAMVRIMFVQYSANFSGSTVSGLMVAEALIEGGCHVDAVFAFDGPMIKQYEQAGCQTDMIAHGEWLRPGGRLRCLRRFARDTIAARQFTRLMRSRQVDLVYVNSLVGLAPILAARRCRIPSIWHLRELFDDVGGELRFPAIGGRRLVREAVRRLPDRGIAISHTVVDNVLGTNPGDRIAVIPNAVGQAFFEPLPAKPQCRRRLNLPQDVPLVGLPGTLRPVKGIPLFIDAAERLHRTEPACHFAITGHGSSEFEARMRGQVHDCGLDDRIHFVGTIQQMRDFYGSCDIICTPSRSESFGRTVVEAMALGVPLVATSVGGICETVTPEQTGILVPYGDAEKLAAALRRLLGDADLRQRLRLAGQATARKHYRGDVYQQRIRQAVDKVLRSRGHRGLAAPRGSKAHQPQA